MHAKQKEEKQKALSGGGASFDPTCRTIEKGEKVRKNKKTGEKPRGNKQQKAEGYMRHSNRDSKERVWGGGDRTGNRQRSQLCSLPGKTRRPPQNPYGVPEGRAAKQLYVVVLTLGSIGVITELTLPRGTHACVSSQGMGKS